MVTNVIVVQVLLQVGQVPHPWFFWKECGKVNQCYLVTMNPYVTLHVYPCKLACFRKQFPEIWAFIEFHLPKLLFAVCRLKILPLLQKDLSHPNKKIKHQKHAQLRLLFISNPGTFMAKSESFLSFRANPSPSIEPLENPMMRWVQGDHLPEFWLHKYFALGMKIVCQCPTIQCFIDHFRYQRPTMFSPFTINMYIAFIAIFKLFWKAKRIQKVNTYLCHVSYMAAKASPISLHPPSVHLGKSSTFEH